VFRKSKLYFCEDSRLDKGGSNKKERLLLTIAKRPEGNRQSSLLSGRQSEKSARYGNLYSILFVPVNCVPKASAGINFACIFD
jgi:hypothetical protein